MLGLENYYSRVFEKEMYMYGDLDNLHIVNWCIKSEAKNFGLMIGVTGYNNW